jgi:hypothetical protein
MLKSIIFAHPYLASFVFLVLWCAFGYLEAKVLSRDFACVTWALATIGSAWAVADKCGLGIGGWLLGIAILIAGAGWIAYYWTVHGVPRQDA